MKLGQETLDGLEPGGDPGAISGVGWSEYLQRSLG